MSKLEKKFMFSLFLILASVFLLSLFLNAHFVQRYFLYQEKQDLVKICDELVANNGSVDQTIKKIEQEHDVVIVQVNKTNDNVLLNERLLNAFKEKGIGFTKYWLWENDQLNAEKNGHTMRLYSQTKLHYSVLVQYLSWDNQFIAVAKIIPSMEKTILLINRITVLVFSAAILVILLLVTILVRKIIIPLKTIGETAKSIAELDFKTVEIRTNDELENLAHDINHMSSNLKLAHETLELKNKEMKDLLANVSHDLKTPVALIKAYASGIKDGIDDGTFLDTIIVHNERIEAMLETLLDLSRLGQKATHFEQVSVSSCLYETIMQYQVTIDKPDLKFKINITDGLFIKAEKKDIDLIISNLISNAIKYATTGPIEITLRNKDYHCIFTIKNFVTNHKTLDLSRIWEPFYVGEKSRNKNLSGTGLGLSIVKSAADKYGFLYECKLEKDMISFTVVF